MKTHRLYLPPTRACATVEWVEVVLKERKASPALLRFAESCNALDSNRLVIAWDSGKVIGYWSLHQTGRYIQSTGTYVENKKRRQGVGKGMWDFMTSKITKASISATAVTPAGLGFLRNRQGNKYKVRYENNIGA